jgi:PAS domain S-box-containing protein
MAGNNLTKRLQKSIIVSSALGIFTVAVIIALAGIVPLHNYLIKEEERSLLLALNAKTIAVEEYLARVKDVAAQITSRTKAREMLEQYNEGKVSLSDLAGLTGDILLDAMNFTPEVWGISRLDLKGNLVVQVGLEVPQEFLVPADPVAKHASFLGPISLGSQSYLVIRSPILDRKSALVGTDIALFRLYNLQRIIEDYTGMGNTGDTILGIVENGRIDVLFPSRDNKLTLSTNVPGTSPIGSAMLKTAEKRTGLIVPGKSVEGNEVIAYGPIRGSNWGIALKINRDELFGPVDRLFYTTNTIIVALIFLGTLGMILLVRPLAGKTIIHSRELEQEIKDKTATLRKELRERKRMERWLRDSERRHQILLANVPDVIFIIDENGRFSYANIQIEKFLECPVREILETPLQDHIVPEDRARIQNILGLGVEEIWDEEVGVIDAKGGTKYARIRCKASLEEETGLRRYEGVMRDITMRKQLEDELKASREELLEKIKIIDDLYEHILQTGMSRCISDHTAEVAHELRQPLAIIGGFARRMSRQILSGQIAATPEQIEYCSIIISEIQRLEKILDSLIDFTAHDKIQLENVDPNELIQVVLLTHAYRIQEKNLQLQTDLGKEIGEILLDPTLFEQVVRNLISDAIEASPPDQVISVESGVSIPSDKAQETGGLDSETYFELKVRNFGKIIPREELQKIFSPFYTTNNYGAGIGLTISKRIVEDHKGSISVKSDQEGTVFTVWLPLNQGIPSRKPVAQNLPMHHRSS